MLIRVKRINNFLLFHACFISMSHVFTILLYHFEAFYWTNLLTRCPVPVPYFCAVFITESYFWKYSRNWMKIYDDFFIKEIRTRARRETPGGTHTPGVGPTCGWALGRGRGLPLACVGPLESPFWLRSSFLQ